MGKRFPHVWLLGDKTYAETFLRRAHVELYRTKRVAEEMGVPIYQRRVMVSESVLIDTSISHTGEHITISASRLPKDRVSEDRRLRPPEEKLNLFALNPSDSDPDLTFVIYKEGGNYKSKVYEGQVYAGSLAHAAHKKASNLTGWTNYSYNQRGDVLTRGLARDATNQLFYRGYLLTEFDHAVIGAFVTKYFLVVLTQSTSSSDSRKVRVYTLKIPSVNLSSTDFEFGNQLPLSDWDLVDVYDDVDFVYSGTPESAINYVFGTAINKSRTEITTRWLKYLLTYSLEERIVGTTPSIAITRAITPHETSGLRTSSNNDANNYDDVFSPSVHIFGYVYHQTVSPRLPGSVVTYNNAYDLAGDFCAAFNYDDDTPQRVNIPTWTASHIGTTLDTVFPGSPSWDSSCPYPMAGFGAKTESFTYAKQGTTVGPTSPTEICDAINVTNEPDVAVLNSFGFISNYARRDHWSGSSTFIAQQELKAPWGVISNWSVNGGGTSSWVGAGDKFSPHEYYEYVPDGAGIKKTPVPWHNYIVNASGSYAINVQNTIYTYVDLEADVRQEWHIDINHTHTIVPPPSTQTEYSNLPYIGSHTGINGTLAMHHFSNKIIINGIEFDVGFEPEEVEELLTLENRPVYFGFHVVPTGVGGSGTKYTLKPKNIFEDTFITSLIDDGGFSSTRHTNIYVFKHPSGDLMIGGKKQYKGPSFHHPGVSEVQGNFLYVYDSKEKKLVELYPILETALGRYNKAKTATETLASFTDAAFLHTYMPTGKVIGDLPDSVEESLI